MMRRLSWQTVLSVGAIAIAYLIAAQISLFSLQLGVQVLPIWPPAGIALAVVIWQKQWSWLGILLGSLGVNAALHTPWPLAVEDAFWDTAQAVGAAFILKRTRFCISFARLRDVLGFVSLVVLAIPIVGAIVGTAMAYHLSQIGWNQALQHGWILWVGDAMGILVLTPLLLTGRIHLQQGSVVEWRLVRSLTSYRRKEKFLWLGLFILASGLVFYSNIQFAAALYPLEYLPFPFVIWAALRFGLPHTALANFILSAIAISGTAQGYGPFAAMSDDTRQKMLLLQAFIGIIAITALIVAAVTTEHQQAEAEMRLTAERNRLLSEISQKIRQSLDLEAILETTVAEVRRFLQADRVFITRFDPSGGGSVVAESVAPGWDSMMGWTVDDPAIRLEVQKIFEFERIKVIEDTETIERTCLTQHCHSRYQVRAGISVPIMIGAKMSPCSVAHGQENLNDSYLFGVLVVNQCSAPRRWQTLEIDLMQQLGTQVAIAIQQAQLYQQVQRLNTNLEMQVAERTFQLQKNMEELAELNQFRDVLIHAIAHDLRTTVIGNLMVLKNLQQQPGEKIFLTRSLLERMTDSGEVHLNKLNGLLEVYTYKTEGVMLNPKQADLIEILQDVILELKPLLEQNRVILANQLPPELPSVWIDPEQIRRVFKHLLINAIKHNPPGVTITLLAQIEAEMLRFKVEDNGKGIPPSRCDRLFDLRLCSCDTRQLVGVSLGLYLSQQIATAHGGRISVASRLEQGSIFELTLPLAV
jgi:signal transduction histidine kinase/integral membrane sensor domain MASE1